MAVASCGCHPRTMPSSEEDEIDYSAIQVSYVGSARRQWPSEVKDLSPWVRENLGELGRQLGMQLEIIGSEVPVSAFRADIIAKDGSGRSVLIENQLGPSDHGHFGQIVIYALESKVDVVIWLVLADMHQRMWGGIRPEHDRALAQLNVLFAGKIQFYGVELTLESEKRPMGETSTPILLPKLTVVVRPNESGQTV
jgi:hypothetical protein